MTDRKRLDDPNYDWQLHPWPSEIYTLHSGEANMGGEGSLLNANLAKLTERTDWLLSRCNQLQAQVEAFFAGGGGGGGFGGPGGGLPPNA